MVVDTTITAARVTAPTGPRWTLWLLRSLAGLFLLAVLAQPVLAGLYLSGEWDALGLHSANATIVQSLSLFLLLSGAGGAAAAWLAGCGIDLRTGQTAELLRSAGPLPVPFRVPLPIPPVRRPVDGVLEITQRVAEVEILPGST